MIFTKESYFKFSGGEVHYKCPPAPNLSNIVMADYTMDGFMAMAEHVQILRQWKMSAYVTYPYFPYARQDRKMEGDEPFSLKIFCDMVNSLNLDSITVMDPHSDVIPALLNNCVVQPQWELAKQIIPKHFADILYVSPDAGAYKKVAKLVKDTKQIVVGVKHRDSAGNISGTDILSNVSLENRECIMVDDICDGGRTFIELAKVLKEKGAAKIYLYVTHGIFSKGMDVIFYAGIDQIFTTNSFPQLVDKRISMLDLYKCS